MQGAHVRCKLLRQCISVDWSEGTVDGVETWGGGLHAVAARLLLPADSSIFSASGNSNEDCATTVAPRGKSRA
jgi:hypothetical protein